MGIASSGILQARIRNGSFTKEKPNEQAHALGVLRVRHLSPLALQDQTIF